MACASQSLSSRIRQSPQSSQGEIDRPGLARARFPPAGAFSAALSPQLPAAAIQPLRAQRNSCIRPSRLRGILSTYVHPSIVVPSSASAQPVELLLQPVSAPRRASENFLHSCFRPQRRPNLLVRHQALGISQGRRINTAHRRAVDDLSIPPSQQQLPPPPRQTYIPFSLGPRHVSCSPCTGYLPPG